MDKKYFRNFLLNLELSHRPTYLCLRNQEYMTRDEILEFVKKAGLKPADIVAKSNGLIPITQAYDWLRTWKFSMSTLLLLEVYAKKDSGSSEIFSEFDISPVTKESFDGIAANAKLFDEIAFSAKDTPSMRTSTYEAPVILETIREKKKNQKIPDFVITDNGSENVVKTGELVYRKTGEPVYPQKPKAFTTEQKEKKPLREKKVDLSEQKIPAKSKPYGVWLPEVAFAVKEAMTKLPSATPTGFASWGTNMTMKRVGNIIKLNFDGKGYTINADEAVNGFLVDGAKCYLNDFTAF